MHTILHMSPARVAGVSRWTIIRAIKSHELLAVRDNRNHWRIASGALDNWQAHIVRTEADLHTLHITEMIEIKRLKNEVQTERRLRQAAHKRTDTREMIENAGHSLEVGSCSLLLFGNILPNMVKSEEYQVFPDKLLRFGTEGV